MMFQSKPEDIARARDAYFDRKHYALVFDRLPRVAEIFDVIAARQTERIAMMHLHSAFLMANMANYLQTMGAASGTSDVAYTLSQSMTRHLFLLVDLDFGHMASLIRAIQDDGKDLMQEMSKGLS